MNTSYQCQYGTKLLFDLKRIKLFIKPELFDLLSGHASVWPVDGVWEQNDHIELFVEDHHVDDVLAEIKQLPDSFHGEMIVKTLENTNWNAEWEANFDPVQVGNFCLIYAPFHTDLADCTHQICLMPKMAFGTGHHETTYMMIEQMSQLDFTDKTVFDFGCGTAVLSVLAEKMGASEILAVDHEAPAVDNSIENAGLNNAQRIEVVSGTLAEVPVRPYDIILANINFGVLITTAEQLKSYVHSASHVLLSGILVEKKEEIKKEYQAKGWSIVNEKIRGEWTSFLIKLVE